jgi:hypothetical protein
MGYVIAENVVNDQGAYPRTLLPLLQRRFKKRVESFLQEAERRLAYMAPRQPHAL